MFNHFSDKSLYNTGYFSGYLLVCNSFDALLPGSIAGEKEALGGDVAAGRPTLRFWKIPASGRFTSYCRGETPSSDLLPLEPFRRKKKRRT